MTVNLNLGCGDQKLPGFIGVDRLGYPDTDVICDLNYPLPFKSLSIDYVYAKSILEHLNDLASILTEVERILKPGGTFYIYVPHWSNPFYYSDYTHQHTFGLVTLDYFIPPSAQVFRKVPAYQSLKFQITGVRLLFESPFGWLRWMMKGFQWLVNRRKDWLLFYEYHLSGVVPCYAIEFVLCRIT